MTKKTLDEESVKKAIIMAGIVTPAYLVGKSYFYQAIQSRGIGKIVGMLGAGAMTALTGWSAYHVMPDIVERGFATLHDHVKINVNKEESDAD